MDEDCRERLRKLEEVLILLAVNEQRLTVARTFEGRTTAWLPSHHFPHDVRTTLLDATAEDVAALDWPTRDALCAVSSRCALSESRDYLLYLSRQELGSSRNSLTGVLAQLEAKAKEGKYTLCRLLYEAAVYNWCVAWVNCGYDETKGEDCIQAQNADNLSSGMLEGLFTGAVPMPESALRRSDFGNPASPEMLHELGRIEEIMRTDLGFSQELLQLVNNHCRQ